MDFRDMPITYGRCPLGTDCPAAASCLRALAWQQTETRGHWLTIVNPHFAQPGDSCPYYVDATEPKCGKGLKLRLDDVPLAQARQLKAVLEDRYGRTRIWKMKTGAVIVSEHDRADIAALCRKYGAPEPQYEEDVFPWSEG